MKMNDGYTLYGSRGSGSAAIEAALVACGVPWRQVNASSWEPGPGFDELRRVNPLGQIPTLVLPDGTVLTESAAILIHLGLEHPHAGLLPQQPSARARAIRGLVYVAANCYAAIGLIDYPERFCDVPDEAARKRTIAVARKCLHGLWDVFADTTPPSAGGWLGGDDRPGALDLLACVVSKWSGARAHLKSSRPTFFALLQRVEQHPSFKPVFDAHWPA
ncbi:glutathione S-transferase family protein [Caldimonas sp. KR1-144]|uniref:glutathione S-transferase family protein n=1 Tax=Caldimonas sp. KR1-144 TaxID=3400911 RepID=UPI003C0C1106